MYKVWQKTTDGVVTRVHDIQIDKKENVYVVEDLTTLLQSGIRSGRGELVLYAMYYRVQ